METELETRADPWSAAAVDGHRGWLTAYVLAVTGDPGAADDLVQEVFAVALSKRGEFAPGTNFGGWLRGIARNVALRHGERRGRELPLAGDEALARLDRAAERAEREDLVPGATERRAIFLRQCLEQLAERTRRLVELRYAEDRSAAEAAAELGMTVTAVNVAAFRARAALADCIERKERQP